MNDMRKYRTKPPSSYPVELQNLGRDPSVGGERADEEVLPVYEPAREAEEQADPVGPMSGEAAVGEEGPPGYEVAVRERGSVDGGRVEEGAVREAGNGGH
jgi:hypothetical protein